MDKKKRLLHLDVMRLIAIYLVLFNHTADKGYKLFMSADSLPVYYLELCFDILVMTAVPVFLTVSGATLLQRNESYSKLFFNRIFRFSAILFTASVINYKYICIRDGKQFLIKDFFRIIYSDGVITAYWYMYMYIAMLCMLPLLRYMAQNMKNKDFMWMFVMYLLITTVPILDFALFKGDASHNPNFQFFITSSYIIYPFAGYYIENRLDQKYFRTDVAFLLLGFSAFTVCVTSRLCDWRAHILNPWSINDYGAFFMNYSVILVVTLHYCLKLFFMIISVPQKTERIITTVAGATFFVYLFENVWRFLCLPVYDFLVEYMDPFAACLIYVFASVVMGEIVGIIYYWIKGKVMKHIEWNA